MRSGGSRLPAIIRCASPLVLCALLGGALAACTSPSTTATTTTTSLVQSADSSGVTTWGGSPADSAALPLDDHDVSSTPEVGYVDSCVTTFSGGKGASVTGPWIDSSNGTYDATTKPHVEGDVTWSAASHSFTISGSDRVLETNDLPAGEPTGTFPISRSDPVFTYTGNPNSIEAQDFDWSVPAGPVVAASPSCTGLGPIGVSMDGVVIFNALDAEGRDAAAHEVLDVCDGHPQDQGIYHYHTFTSCMTTATTSRAGVSVLVGYALDGFGIYLQRDAHGDLPTDADLDTCHGIVSPVTWNGQVVDMFHYDVTETYPFMVGCYMGTPTHTATGRPQTAAALREALAFCGIGVVAEGTATGRVSTRTAAVRLTRATSPPAG